MDEEQSQVSTGARPEGLTHKVIPSTEFVLFGRCVTKESARGRSLERCWTEGDGRRPPA